jgi:hypothetical protein
MLLTSCGTGVVWHSHDVRDDTDRTGDHVVQDGLELVETKALEDERAERGDTTRDERDAED